MAEVSELQLAALSIINSMPAMPGRVVMMCGVAGSGKTTFAKRLEQAGYVRLSIDEYIWQRFGKYGVDYAQEQYAQCQALAESDNLLTLKALLQARTPCVIDYSFWSRGERSRYRTLITDAGGEVTLVYFSATLDVLRKRLQHRNQTQHANAAFAIDDDVLQHFLHQFEAPLDEPNVLVIPQTA